MDTEGIFSSFSSHEIRSERQALVKTFRNERREARGAPVSPSSPVFNLQLNISVSQSIASLAE